MSVANRNVIFEQNLGRSSLDFGRIDKVLIALNCYRYLRAFIHSFFDQSELGTEKELGWLSVFIGKIPLRNSIF